GLIGDALGDANRIGERRRVDAEATAAFLCRYRKDNLERTALEPLARERARPDLEPFVADRRTKTQIEAAAIDAFCLQAPAQPGMRAARISKSGHADKRQGVILGIASARSAHETRGRCKRDGRYGAAGVAGTACCSLRQRATFF